MRSTAMAALMGGASLPGTMTTQPVSTRRSRKLPQRNHQIQLKACFHFRKVRIASRLLSIAGRAVGLHHCHIT
jgi:hypothetical protein